MSFTPPISQPPFFYTNNTLYAETSTANRHPRAPICKLKSLLRPDLVADPWQAGDEVGHWYEAQCIHYGLQPSKTKAVAKVRLLNALNEGALRVPREIELLEGEMKKEWVAKEKKAKGQYKASLGSKSSSVKKDVEASGSRKRKHTVESINVNVNIDFGGYDQQGQRGESSAAYSQKSSPPKRKRAVTPVAIKREPEYRSEPQSWSSPIKKRETNYGANVTLGLINGYYDIQCPRIAQEWGPAKLSLIPVMDTPRIWIRYDFNMFRGAMLLPERPYSVPQRIDFECRGNNCRNQRYVTEQSSAGHIVFLGNGRIEGTLRCDEEGDFDFSGTRRDSSGTAMIPKMEMVERWNSYEVDRYN